MGKIPKTKIGAQNYERIKLMRERGLSLRQIAKEFGCSAERIRQITLKGRKDGKIL